MKKRGATGATASARAATTSRLPKDVVLLQLALVFLAGETLTYERLMDEFLLERRTAERYLAHLKEAGLPVVAERVGREARFTLDARRAKDLKVEAVDVPPAAARSLSLLLVAAALLPAHLGVREAVDATVRAALRLRGMKAARELRRLEDAVLVLENDAKDYAGKSDVFGVLLDATLSGSLVRAAYRSPQRPLIEDAFWCASIGLYRGGLYALAVPQGHDGSDPVWRALERVEGLPVVDADGPKLAPDARLRAIDAARRRWGPAKPGRRAGAQVVTLHFDERVAPYVLARPWHPMAEMERWPKDQGGGVRMALRLEGRTDMFESWVKSWGPSVQVLRPADMAERIAGELEEAARLHRAASKRFAEDLDEG